MHTKLSLGLVLLFLAMGQVSVKAQSFVWAKYANQTDNAEGYGASQDGNGNVYVVGSFQGATCTFGTYTLHNTNASGGNTNMFIVKYDSSGNVLWAKSAGGTNWDGANAVKTDANGNSYVVGSFTSSSIVFGTTTLTNANSGAADVFVAKYDAGGNVLWAKSGGGGGNDYGGAVTIDGSGNCYVTGTCDLGATFGTTTLSVAGGSDAYVVKYSSAGAFDWAITIGGSGTDGAGGIACDGSGNCYVTGYYGAGMTVGSTTLPFAGGDDVYLVKLNSSGSPLWAKSAGGGGQDIGFALATDAAGNCFVSGYFYSPTITFGGTTLTNNSGNEAFTAEYNTSGTVIWAANGVGTSWGQAISTDGNGNCYTTGYFTGNSIVFGGTTLVNYSSQISGDIFVVKYNSTGNVGWAIRAGGDGAELGSAITSTASGTCYITGSFTSSTIAFGNTNITNPGGAEMYVAKIGPCNVSLALAQTVCSNQQTILLSGGNPAGGSYTLDGAAATVITPWTLSPGTHTVVYTNGGAGGCTGSATTSINLVQAPAVTLSGLANSYLLTDAPVQLMGTPAGGVFTGPGVVQGNTFSPSQAGIGTSTVVYAYYNGCINTDALCVTVDTHTGLNPNNNPNSGNSFSVWPNPSNGGFLVTLNSSAFIGTAVMEIYTSTGQLVHAETLNEQGLTIEKSIQLNVAAGIYYLKLTANNTTYTQKLVVQ